MAGKYLGTVAQAPAVFQGQQALAAVESAENSTSEADSPADTVGELGWAVIGFQNLFPNETLSWLDPTYQKRLALAKKAQACYDSMEAIATGLDLDQIIDLSDATVAMQALRVIGTIDELTPVGNSKSGQPVLVVQGLADVSVLPEVVESAYNVTCETGSVVHLQLYPGLDHDPLIPAAAPSFLQWMDDRFDGVTAEEKCSKKTVYPFNSKYLYAPLDED